MAYAILMSFIYAANTTGNNISYNSTEPKSKESLNALFCNWGDSLFYTECTLVNRTTNMTDVKNLIRNLIENNTITDQNITQLINMGESQSVFFIDGFAISYCL